jgi:ATP:ADP antiporter, AAA family
MSPRTNELRLALIAGAYFFCLLAAYYVLRPLRDEMGVLFGPERLQWLFTGTFVATLLTAPLFAWLVARYPRRVFLPMVYALAGMSLFAFWVTARTYGFRGLIVPGFFIYLSVFNLFVVSVFWSFLAEVFDRDEAARWFPAIAAGGTLGALAGPLLTKLTLRIAGQTELILLSIALLGLALTLMLTLKRMSPARATLDSPKPIGGGVWAGLRALTQSRYLTQIALIVFLYVEVSTILYFQQTALMAQLSDSSVERTRLFAQRDLYVNATTFVLQFLGTAWLIKKIGTRWLLLLCPLIIGALLLAFAANPSFGALIVLQVVHRASDFAILKPIRDLLFTVVEPEAKYKAKNFIDVTVYRFGDLVSAWVNAGFGALQAALITVAGFGAAVCVVWAAIGFSVGRTFDRGRTTPVD